MARFPAFFPDDPEPDRRVYLAPSRRLFMLRSDYFARPHAGQDQELKCLGIFGAQCSEPGKECRYLSEWHRRVVINLDGLEHDLASQGMLDDSLDVMLDVFPNLDLTVPVRQCRVLGSLIDGVDRQRGERRELTEDVGIAAQSGGLVRSRPCGRLDGEVVGHGFGECLTTDRRRAAAQGLKQSERVLPLAGGVP